MIGRAFKLVGILTAALTLLAGPVWAGDAAPSTRDQAHEPPQCMARPGRVSQLISGEIMTGQLFRTPVGNRWFLELRPVEHGWVVAVVDIDGLDLSAITPPYTGTNARQLFGWHFRNKNNSGPNKGDVNAPQTERLFVFDGALTGTGGFKPSPGAAQSAQEAPGRGLLSVLDFGLADLEKGQQARLVYLKFSICLNWPETDEELALVSYTDETVEQFAACGLMPPFQLSAYVRPRSISADFDGDNIVDMAAPVADMQGGKRAIAICRAGRWLDILGAEAAIGEVVPAYFESIDRWGMDTKGPVSVGAGGPQPPELLGDALIIGKESASSSMIYWTGQGWASYWLGD